ncbi:MAG: hypothetical protein M5R36_02940 [Deltaproteobacteria bacterium]|nr:hypothetical protein [Deltaproteobacteria bacterium]
MSLIVPLLGNLLGAIEIPTIGGYGVDILDFKGVGGYSDFIGIYGNLIQP